MLSEFFNDLNWLSVLLGAIGYFMLGAIWYSFLFKRQWINYTGTNVDDPNIKKGVAVIMFGSFIMMLVTAFGLAIISYYAELKGWQSGLKLGLLTGIGFAFTSMAINMLYEKKHTALYFINGGYQILGNIIAAVIICAWRN